MHFMLGTLHFQSYLQLLTFYLYLMSNLSYKEHCQVFLNPYFIVIYRIGGLVKKKETGM